MRRVWTNISFLVLILSATIGYAQQVPPAGTSINNQAKAILITSPQSRDTMVVYSNMVSVSVQAVGNLSLKTNHQRQTRAGQTETFTHRLVNNGNTTENVKIRAVGDKNNQFDMDEILLLSKAKINNTGAAGVSDSLRVSLSPGQEFVFNVFMSINVTAKAGQQAKVSILAETGNGNVMMENTDIIEILEGPVMQVEKQQSNGNPQQGDRWNYRISATNTGDQVARSVSLSIDGNPQEKVLLRDPIPANTTFAAIEEAKDVTPLYHIIGTPEKEYISALPPDLSTIDEFAVVTDSLSAGQQIQAEFAVNIHQNATGSISNTAQLEFRDPVDKSGDVSTVKTNTVSAVLPGNDETLDYYTNDSYSNISRATQLGSPLLLQASAGGCNLNFGARDTLLVMLRSQKTDDQEQVQAIETGNNTGYFRISPSLPTRSSGEFEVKKNSGILETIPNDVIMASFPKCSDQSKDVTAQVVVSPFGVVFDGRSGVPVAGAVVKLVTGDGAPAQVLNEEGDKEVANPQTTKEDGKFTFPYVLPGTYRIEITTPAGYQYASVVPPSELPQSHTVHEQGSYGQKFSVSDKPKPVAFDIPLDRDSGGDLFIEKNASVTGAEIGEFVTYQIKVANNSSGTIPQVHIEDTLPFGFKYEKGTAQLDGNAIKNPEGGKGPSLRFAIGDMEGGNTVILTYRALLGPGVRNGDATNTALAKSDGGVTKVSNEAQNTIEVRGGVFTDKGYIIGKVFADCNENDVQDAGEDGIPGVRLYLENGSFVITDSEGKYTFYGIRPNKHVVKIDNYSLPKGSKLSVLDNRHAGDPSSRFVDLKTGQMHRADFAICNCTHTIHSEIKDRRAEYHSRAGNELGTSIKRNFSATENQQRSSVKREQASGVINGEELPNAVPSKTKAHDSLTIQPVNRFQNPADSVTSLGLTLEEAMVKEQAELGFIGVTNKDTLPSAGTKIWVKSKLGASLKLTVNGEEIDDNRISKNSTLAKTGLQAQEYIGIKLQPGKNILAVSETDPFGNKRGEKAITVFAAGEVAGIKLDIPVNDVSADGSSAAVVRIQVQDKSGIAIQSKLPITLDVSAGQWQVQDLDPSTPGTQTYIEGGTQEFRLQSTIKPQDANVRISIGVLEAEATVHFLPDLRPLIAAGVIEGTLRLNGDASMVPARSADGFERELKSLSYSKGNTIADARAAFFLKGKIKGNILLTAGFDSEKEDGRLFRDIQPDEFYPVYGESSVKGYDAQSTSRLYVRVDQKRTYALYGDLVTQERHPAKSLGEYNRTQTGLKLHYEKDWVRLNAFGSQATSLQRIDEFRGQGISGPYELNSNNILVNSEQVEIITRDRNQPALVINRERLSRFSDYVIEPFSGNLLFKSAVPSVDEELNPLFIRVTYEVEGGAEEYLIGGADGQFKVTNFLELGGSFVEDRNPEDQYQLKSANSTLRLGENTTLLGEVAESTTELEGNGRGGRVELQHRGDKVDARVFAGQTDEHFVNRSAQLGQARTEAGARGSMKITNSTDLAGEFLYSSNDTLNTNTTGGVINVQQQFTKGVRAEVGVRYAKQNSSQLGSGSAQDDITHKNIRGKLSVDVPNIKGASLLGEYEQDIRENDRKLIAIGGNYRLSNIGKLYGRHEFISSAVGPYNLNSHTKRQNTAVGIDAKYMKGGKVYSEYRVDDAFDGQNAQAAIGLRNQFQIREGFGINAGFERIFSITGDPLNEGTAISTAIDYTANPMWKGTARVEARFSNNSNSYLNTLGYGRKINQNWTFLGKNIFNLQTSTHEGTPDRIQQRLRTGFAYRQTNQNRWDGLGRYELKYEENGQFGGDFNRLVHIFSTNVNYHPSSKWTHSGRFAAKKVAESSAEFDSQSLTMLMSARTIYDITRKLDGSINASLMTDAGFAGKDYGAGIEVGYIVQRNLRLAVGFNVFGYEDRDLAASNQTRKGLYVGFSYKFDERLFRGLMPDEDKNSPVYAECDKCKTSAKQTNILQMPEANIDDIKPPALTIKAPELDSEIVKPKTKLAKNVHFATDRSALSYDSKRILNKIVDYWKDNGQENIEIIGHSDSRGSKFYNMKLSEQRASAVKQYLVSQGLHADLIAIKGLGESKLAIDPENDGIDFAINRRVEFNIDNSNISVQFVDQYNDLKIDKPVGAANINWDYIFNTNFKAVPDRIHITADTLGYTTQYLLNRIRLAMQYDTDATITFNIAGLQAEHRKEILSSYLKRIGADMKRINIILGSATEKTKDGRVEISYGDDLDFLPVAQRDDVRFASGKYIEPLLEKMLNRLEQQQHLIISKADAK